MLGCYQYALYRIRRVNVSTDRESYLTMPSVCLSPVLCTLAGRTANIDINKSIGPDIPFRRRGKGARLWRRKQSRPDAKVTGIFHDSSLAPSFISLPPCPVRYASRRSPMFHPSLLHRDNLGRRPHHSYRGLAMRYPSAN